MPAEWEHSAAVLVAFPHEKTDWAYMLDEVQACYVEFIKAISCHAVAIVIAPDTTRAKEMLVGVDNIIYFDVATNDTWTRDYGVICTEDNSGNLLLNDFGFNAWGGKFAAELDNQVTRRMYEAGLIKGEYLNRNNFILEGGSIESDGCATIMTTDSCLLTETRNPEFACQGSKLPYEEYLRETLGAKQVLWVKDGSLDGDDTDGHIDTIARIAPNDTILYCAAGERDDAQARSLRAMKECISEFRTLSGMPYNLIELPIPDPIYDEDGERLPATYANYLVLNDAVLMPTYGQEQNDLLASKIIKVAFPEHEVIGVDCRALIRQHGSLHCATMQIPVNAFSL